MILVHHLLLLFCSLLVLIVRNYDHLSAKRLGILDFLAERASASEHHQEKALIAREVIHLSGREIIIPAERLTTLAISSHWCNYLTDARCALLEPTETNIRQLGRHFAVRKLIFEVLWIHDCKTSKGLVSEHAYSAQ